ncbi:S-adenosyl-L-methionine-dependent methyltransferase [Lactarius quietus]|nr:S-adenosyl-L-methionine-dependent methyltransferase [Lactarius quietus]
MIYLGLIIQKCNLHWLASDEKEPLEDGFNRFFCSGLIWDEDLDKDAPTSLVKFLASLMAKTKLLRHELSANIIKTKDESSPIQALELFSGAGGLSIGLEDTGFVKTKWAVECAPSAARTFQYNKQHANVYNQDCNLLLEHAIETNNGKKLPPLRSLTMDSRCHHCRGLVKSTSSAEVSIVNTLRARTIAEASLGPPVKGSVTQTDIQNSLVCNMLSFVEFYKPKFFLLENVLGLLNHKLQVNKPGPQEGEMVANGIINYQVRFNALQARARHGPQADPVTRDPERPYDGAPHRAVTVDDAISDLPKFDWVIKVTQGDRAMVKRRAAVGIPAFEAASGPGATQTGVIRQRAAHALPGPCSEDIAEDADVELHYTARYSESVVERVCNVAIKPSADWRSLPRQLQVKKVDRDGATSSRDIRFSRVNGSGHFRTAMTTLMPNAQGSTVLHPTQKRVLTVRECARAQGFPDSWKFLSVSDRPSTIVRDVRQLRQIGNAVPVPLSRALGKELGKALIKMWEAEDKARESGSPEL